MLIYNWRERESPRGNFISDTADSNPCFKDKGTYLFCSSIFVSTCLYRLMDIMGLDGSPEGANIKLKLPVTLLLGRKPNPWVNTSIQVVYIKRKHITFLSSNFKTVMGAMVILYSNLTLMPLIDAQNVCVDHLMLNTSVFIVTKQILSY